VTASLHRHLRPLLLACAAAVGVLAWGPGARVVGAQEAVPGEVMVILASESPGTIAPELSGLPALRQPPFSSFPSMRLLATHPISLPVGTAVEVPLPNGRVMSVVLAERTEDGRFRTRVSIPDYLPSFEVRSRPCEPFFLAGQSFGGGRLILGVRLGAGCR
jgi:hypothetical protein